MKKHSGISDKQKHDLEQYGYQYVDEASVGDYDLVLTHFPLLDAYHIALQRKGRDFTDHEQQTQKFPADLGANISLAVPTLNRWLARYGELWIGGDNPAKVPVYERLLKRLGYTTDSMDLMGMKLVSITKPSRKTFTSSLLKKASKTIGDLAEVLEEIAHGHLYNEEVFDALEEGGFKDPLEILMILDLEGILMEEDNGILFPGFEDGQALTDLLDGISDDRLMELKRAL